MRTNITRILHAAGIDRAVSVLILMKMWNIVSAAVTALLITSRFTPAIQGYYYTFSSLLAFQFASELGVGNMIIQFASHEWSALSLDKSGTIQGDSVALSRLQSLARFSVRWFMFIALVFTVGMGVGGYYFFSRDVQTSIHWQSPWISLCLLSFLLFLFQPIWYMLEGCNQVYSIFKIKFWQGVSISISMWIAIVLGAELWTVSYSSIAAFFCAAMLLYIGYRGPLKFLFFSSVLGPRIDWLTEIWPVQWRMAITCSIGPLSLFVFTPLVFYLHGAIVAGQFGMTWSVVTLVGAIATSWIYPRSPQFGLHVARREYEKLDRLLFRITGIACIVCVAVGFCFWLLVYVLNMLHVPLAQRLLAPLPTAILLIGQVFQTLSAPFAIYLRAHKKEPLVALAIVQGALTLTLIFTLGRSFSSLGMAGAFLIVNLIVTPLMLLIWYRCRKAWHGA